MSLDVDLMVTQPVSVYESNITHNLGKMAGAVELSNGMTLYDVFFGDQTNKKVYRLLEISRSCWTKDGIFCFPTQRNIRDIIQRMAGVRMTDSVILFITIGTHAGIIQMQN
jgi:hypothetical protein